jgi:hypothetical protein
MPNAPAFRRCLPLLAIALTSCSSGGGREAAAAAEAGADTVADMSESVTTTKSEWSVAGFVKGRSETTVSEPPPPPPSEREAQAGLLTAGDHDDLLNPEAYAAYAQRFLQAQGDDLPFVDTRGRVAVKVVDARGRPVPFASVDVARRGAPLRLVAAADGTASFYPKFDGVPARTRVSVSSRAGEAVRPLDLAGDGSRYVAVTLPGVAPAVTALDLALVIDTTGSMGDEMAYLQAEIDSIVARLKREAGQLDLRIGVVVYRDDGDEYVVRSTPLTADIGSVRATLERQEADGGGDMPEAVDRALAEAERLAWRPGVAKAMLLVADAPPHAEAMTATLASTQRLRARGVQIVPVAASGVDDSAQYVMRTMAALTQGRYIFLTDDSGVGDPHAEPDLACYAVTRLDQLIARVLAGIVQGRRIEPAPGEVVRVVGRYSRGRCPMSGAAPGQT